MQIKLRVSVKLIQKIFHAHGKPVRKRWVTNFDSDMASVQRKINVVPSLKPLVRHERARMPPSGHDFKLFVVPFSGFWRPRFQAEKVVPSPLVPDRKWNCRRALRDQNRQKAPSFVAKPITGHDQPLQVYICQAFHNVFGSHTGHWHSSSYTMVRRRIYKHTSTTS